MRIIIRMKMREEEIRKIYRPKEFFVDVKKIFAGTSEQKSGQRMRCSANCPSDLMCNDNHQLSIISTRLRRDDEDRGKSKR